MNEALAIETKDTYSSLIELLDEHKAEYTLIDHEPEGRTEIVSPMRGHDASQAAKCMILMVKIGKKDKRFVLGVVPGDAKINMNAIKDLFEGTYISFASSEHAESLARCVAGTILPFSFSSELTLIVDPTVKDIDYIYFNAARLDRSLKLKTSDYIRIANPRFERIAG